RAAWSHAYPNAALEPDRRIVRRLHLDDCYLASVEDHASYGHRRERQDEPLGSIPGQRLEQPVVDVQACTGQVIPLPNEDETRLAMVRQIIRVSADRLPNPIGVRVALVTLDTVGLSQPKQREQLSIRHPYV